MAGAPFYRNDKGMDTQPAPVAAGAMASAREAFKQTFSKRMALRSATVALVVGTALNAINQGPELFTGQPVIIWKLLLTYLVPFLVSSYGSYSALKGQ